MSNLKSAEINSEKLELPRWIAPGDYVRIIKGTVDPFTNADLSGWQGLVLELMDDEESGTVLLIQWDATTLKLMPFEFVAACLEEELNWFEVPVPYEAAELAHQRNTSEETDWAREEICQKWIWPEFGAEGKKIKNVTGSPIADHHLPVIAGWHNEFTNNLRLPFDGILSETEGKVPLEGGSRLTVVELAGWDEKLGVAATVTAEGRVYILSLVEISPLKPESKNGRLIETYRTWWNYRC